MKRQEIKEEVSTFGLDRENREKKKDSKKQDIDFIQWFDEINKDQGHIAGGKGANLGEMTKMGIPVPKGFVVTAQAYDLFIEHNKLKKKIEELLKEINYEDTENLNEVTKQIRELILQAKYPEELKSEIADAYEALGAAKIDPMNKTASDILRMSSEPIFVAVRSSATTEDLAEASFAGQQDTYLNIKGEANVLENVKKCFASLFTSRATYYRKNKGFKHMDASLAVVIQKMIDSKKSGVIFSKDPSNNSENIVIEAVFGLGEGIVSGKITPDYYLVSRTQEILKKEIADKKIAFTRDSSGKGKTVKLIEEKSKLQVLSDFETKKLAGIAIKLEKHYKKPQDIEFAIEGENIYIVQTRPITTIKSKQSDKGLDFKGEIILEGIPASPGIASGTVRLINEMSDLKKIKEGDILVTKMTNPDMVVSMQKSKAIVTDEGGRTAHAAIVSREMGIPAIVGTKNATRKLKDGQKITVDGSKGKVFSGATLQEKKEIIEPVTQRTKTEIKVIVDLPNFAKRAAETGIKKVGLTRIEGIIAETGKHPQFFLENNTIQEYQKIIYQGIKKIAEFFEEIWVRTSDIRSDEFKNLTGAPKENEANPMLGMHGIRYGLKNKEVLKAELKALHQVQREGKEIGILLPQIISVEEVKQVKIILNEIGFSEGKLGIMLETPAAIQMIRNFCDEGIKFISFGTNDLTQYILAVDRGNEKVQHLYNEMHPALLYQIEYAIRVCKRNGVKTSICGQAGSKKEMVKFLIEKGIDSISVNADAAKEISEYVKEIERKQVEGTDKEPRAYQPPHNKNQK